jgi:hypothetical protein
MCCHSAFPRGGLQWVNEHVDLVLIYLTFYLRTTDPSGQMHLRGQEKECPLREVH